MDQAVLLLPLDLEIPEIDLEIPPLDVELDGLDWDSLADFSDVELPDLSGLVLPEAPAVELEEMALEIGLWPCDGLGGKNRKTMDVRARIGKKFVTKTSPCPLRRLYHDGGILPFRRTHPDAIKSGLVVYQIVTKTSLLADFDCQIIDGRLYYRTKADDGTLSLRLIDRPKDINKGLWNYIRNRLPPGEYYR